MRRLNTGLRPQRGLLITLLTVTAVLVPTVQREAAASITADVDLEVVASGLSLAVDLAAPPGDDRLFVVEKVGRIRIVKDGTVLGTAFLDITGPVRSSANEQGLLGLAFPPDYAESGLFYVHYTSDAGSGDTTIAEYRVSGNPDVADPNSGRILFTTNQPNTNHNGGGIQFGHDGYLYASIGDGGGGGDPGENGQNKNTTLGSIIRLDPSTGEPAQGNPFIDAPGADEIWAWGLRNPWRFSFDRATGDMYIGDVGQGLLEEIDVAPAGVGGLNFGWDAYEGTDCFEGPCNPAGLTFPVTEYAHRSGGACGGSVTGGYVYRGNDLPWLRGHYFYADWCHGDIKSFRLKGGKAVQKINWTSILGAPGFITAFGEDGFGELHMLAQGNVYKFVSTRRPDCDFNGDGYADVAAGSPGETLGGQPGAGRVLVFHGANGPLDPASNQVFRPGEGGLPGGPQLEAFFGDALACGDFNGDGYADLGVGVPRDGDGKVHVIYGGAGGLSATGSEYFDQATLGVGAGGGAFGTALDSGDLNRDGFDDLVVGAPGDDEAGPALSGSVTAVFGSAGGLSGAQLFHQDTPKIKGVAESGDQLGFAVAVGDVDGDGFADIISGIPGEGVSGTAEAGAVAVIFGRGGGVGTRDQLIHRDTSGIKASANAADRFGSTLAVGIFDIDGFDDVAIGVERSDRSGAVHVIHGARSGLGKRDVVYRQGALGITGIQEANDLFGSALDSGDADGDGFDELAIGARLENHNGVANAGLVGVIPGSTAGLQPSQYTVWHQAVAGVKGTLEIGDGFGSAVRFLDTSGDGRLDLVIGARSTNNGAGELHWLPGRNNGLTSVGDVRWDQNSPGVPGVSEPGDLLGWAL